MAKFVVIYVEHNIVLDIN